MRGDERRGEARGEAENQMKPFSLLGALQLVACTQKKQESRRHVPSEASSRPPLSLSSTSDTYLTHTVEGTGEAVIGNGCVSGFDRPHGLTVRG